jgi:hypothetical protein
MPGATSADVHTGLGHPGSGMTSREIRHGGQHGRKSERVGVAKYGTAGVAQGSQELGGANPSNDARQRGLQNDMPREAMGTRGDKDSSLAEDLPPTQALGGKRNF